MGRKKERKGDKKKMTEKRREKMSKGKFQAISDKILHYVIAIYRMFEICTSQRGVVQCCIRERGLGEREGVA